MLYTKIYIIQCNHCNATLKIKLSANIFMNSNKYDDTFTANTELICSLFSLSLVLVAESRSRDLAHVIS